MAWIQLCSETDVPVDDMKQFSINGLEIDVYHLEDGWYATADMCTHQDCSLSEGDLEGREIVCWCHGGAFDVKTGLATRMPCTTPLETFPVRIHNHEVEVQID